MKFFVCFYWYWHKPDSEGLHYVVIERNEKYMASFDEMVPEFIEKMDEALANSNRVLASFSYCFPQASALALTSGATPVQTSASRVWK